MRHTRSHTRNRRSHHSLEGPALSVCSKCGEKKKKHNACSNCGTYKGREVIDVVKAAEKKESKKSKLEETKEVGSVEEKNA